MNSDRHGSPKAIRWWLVWNAIAVVISGCHRYPEISPQAFELAKAVDNLCNLKNASQVPLARQKVDAELQAGNITEREHGWLMSLLETADAGAWEQASTEARKLLASQQNR